MTLVDAQQLLELVQPLGVSGLTITDVDDPTTWVFQGDVDRDAVIGVLRAALAPVVVRDRLADLSATVHLQQQQLEALATAVQFDLPTTGEGDPVGDQRP